MRLHCRRFCRKKIDFYAPVQHDQRWKQALTCYLLLYGRIENMRRRRLHARCKFRQKLNGFRRQEYIFEVLRTNNEGENGVHAVVNLAHRDQQLRLHTARERKAHESHLCLWSKAKGCILAEAQRIPENVYRSLTYSDNVGKVLV